MSNGYPELAEKFDRLKELLREYKSLLVAYSGGVDSSLLLKAAYDVLKDQAVAVTAISPSLPASERELAQAITRWIGVRQIEIDSHELTDPNYLENTPQRCFFCKSMVYSQIVGYAKEYGFQAVIDGTNADDQSDHRPGRQAARQLGVLSPLQQVGLTKSEIRELARQIDLPNWDKPAAACLASRIPYGSPITLELLERVESAEKLLLELGFREVRVRTQEKTARIEVHPDDFAKLLSRRNDILVSLKSLGYVYITLDLQGFRPGSLNEVLITNGRR